MRLHIGEAATGDASRDARVAVDRALEGVRRPGFALVLCAGPYDLGELAEAVTREVGAVPWAGCCAAGVFGSPRTPQDGLVVGVLSDATASFGVGVGGLVSRDARGAGRRAVADAIAPLPPLTGDRRRTFIVFADTVLGNAAEVLRGGVQEAGAGGLWVGGGAGDNLGHVRTAQLGLGRAWHDRVVVVAIDAPLAFGVGIQHGWRPYGPPAMITRAHDDVAVELEDEPAFEVYRKTAAIRGDEVDEELFREFATTHPLGIPQASGEHVIRDPLALSPDGGLRCVGEVPDRAIVRVMQGERLDLVRAAHTAATAARAGVEGSPGGGIVFDCVSRRRVLGDAVSDELRAIQVGLGSGVPLMGCLTFGEIGGSGRTPPQFHNKTAVVLALPPDEGAV